MTIHNPPAPKHTAPPPPPAPPKPLLSSDQELDRIYHAIPEWVHRQFPGMSLAEKVKLGFEYTLKTWTETYIAEVKRHTETNGFVLYLLRKEGLDLSKEYWDYLRFRDSQPQAASDPSSPPKPTASV